MGYMNRDLSKISVFPCDGSECRGDPVDAPRFGSENHIFELFCLREVDRSSCQLGWRENEVIGGDTGAELTYYTGYKRW